MVKERKSALGRMTEIWGCTSWLIEDDIARLHRRLIVANEDMRLHGAGKDEREQFICEQLQLVVDKVVDNYESDRRQAERQEEQFKAYSPITNMQTSRPKRGKK